MDNYMRDYLRLCALGITVRPMREPGWRYDEATRTAHVNGEATLASLNAACALLLADPVLCLSGD